MKLLLGVLLRFFIATVPGLAQQNGRELRGGGERGGGGGQSRASGESRGNTGSSHVGGGHISARGPHPPALRLRFARFRQIEVIVAAGAKAVDKPLTRVAATAINRAIPKRPTCTQRMTAGWDTTQAAMMPIIMSSIPGNTDTSAAKSAATIFTGSKEEAGTVSEFGGFYFSVAIWQRSRGSGIFTVAKRELLRSTTMAACSSEQG